MHRLCTMSHVEGGLDAISPSNCIEKVRLTPHAAANVDHFRSILFLRSWTFPFPSFGITMNLNVSFICFLVLIQTILGSCSRNFKTFSFLLEFTCRLQKCTLYNSHRRNFQQVNSHGFCLLIFFHPEENAELDVT